MTFLIAAAGTGGHVYPGLAVGEALLDLGVDRSEIGYVGGDRIAPTVYPQAGFRFTQLELQGLKRSFSVANLRIPSVVRKARNRIVEEIDGHDIRAVLGMGGYVTVPAALAARKRSVPLFLAEQNANAGLANKFSSRWAQTTFTSFPATKGLEQGEWIGNPVRRHIRQFERASLRVDALSFFDIEPGIPTLGVFGGSLGAKAINDAIVQMISEWRGPRTQVVHLTGEAHHEALANLDTPQDLTWRRLPSTDRMDYFFAVSDLAVGRAGGGLAELTATGTPAILIPGEFGAAGHQRENAQYLEDSGAAEVLAQDDLSMIQNRVSRLLFDDERLRQMREAANEVARPDAAIHIGRAMIEAAR